MYRRILVPLDGSTFAERALTPARELARRSGAALRLVSVVSGEEDRADREHYLGQVTRRLTDVHGIPAAKVGGVVVEGSLPEALVLRVADEAPDLVTMVTHGRGPVERLWMGGIADSMVREGGAPVLLIRNGDGRNEEFSVRDVLLPQDSSQVSRAILPHALRLGSLLQCRFTLLRVLPPQIPFDAGYFPEVVEAERPDEREERRALRALEDIFQPFRDEGLEVGAEVVAGVQPAEGILTYLESRPVDLVALSTRGYGGVRRILLGSVTERLVRAYDGPFLVVRG